MQYTGYEESKHGGFVRVAWNLKERTWGKKLKKARAKEMSKIIVFPHWSIDTWNCLETKIVGASDIHKFKVE